MNTPFCENLFNLCHLCANLLFRGYLHADDNTCPKQIFPFYHQVALGLPKQFPALAQRIAVFIAHMNAAQYLVSVRAERPAQPQIAMMVTASEHARLVGRTHAPSVVVVPERFGANMLAILTFVPFQIDIPEELPRMVVVRFILVTQRQVQPSLIQQACTDLDASLPVIGKTRQSG